MTPPNSKLFDGVNDNSLGTCSSLLQHRMDLQNAAKNPPPAPQPQININFPPQIAQLLQPAHAAAAIPPQIPPPAAQHPVASVPMLIPSHLVPGPNLSVEAFCRQFGLDDDMCAHFTENKYKWTASFEYIELVDLKAMAFLPGKIAELKVAISKWAAPVQP
ncbi:hypothetical protein DFH06DRAFT_1139030 [Mycena polygramma]|nr:hypothetical protein DFH06DRAFT_1139030 [Mycena polygramma]